MDTIRKLTSLTLPWSTDWGELFGAERPIILEIGFGRGVFLWHLAKLYPDANIVGLEIANRCLVAAETTIAREGITNVRVIHSKAETALHHLFVPASIMQIHINFPDPWFKRGHSHRRLMQRDTLDAIVSRLIPDGTLYLATDILDYAEMSADLLAETPGLENLLPAPWVNEMPGRVTTKYEAKARQEGRTCYYFAYRRNDLPAPQIPVIKDLAMPHVVLASPLSLDAIYSQFEPMSTREGELVISLMDAYRGRGSILIEAHVSEATIDQHFGIMLLERDTPGEYTVQMGTIGHPRPTEGVHRAVRRVAVWVVSLDPEAKVLFSKLQSE